MKRSYWTIIIFQYNSSTVMQFGIEAKSLRFDDFSLGGSVTSVAEAVYVYAVYAGRVR